MGVLVCLARHAPRVVSRETLLEEVWGDAFVGDEVVSHAIWELRRALGDSARDPTYIQTIPRKGYRLLAEVIWPKGSPLPVEGAQIEHYEIGRELGRGSMGIVYEAHDRRLDRTVAIKFLAPDLTRDTKACQRFIREARLAASLDHPNLATVLEIGETSEGQHYLVTPFYRGGSLKERLAQGPIPLEEALDLTRQLAAGLGAAHQREIVHRDVKPANLLLDDHGTLKIADFGIAKLIGGTDLTQTGASLGTPAYKSPEQSLGRVVDHRTDIWSLGVVLFELLTGRRPFDGEYEQAVVHSIISREPEVLEDAHGEPIPEELRQVVAKAMAKDPEERYQSAEELVRDLDNFELPAHSEPARSKRSRAVLLAAAVLMAVLVVAIGWGSFSTDRGQPVEKPIPRTSDVEKHLEQANRYELQGDDPTHLNLAEQSYRKALSSDPENATAHARFSNLLAICYINSTDPDPATMAEGVELAIRALKLDRESAEAWAARSRWARLQEDWEMAALAASKALELDPEEPRAYIVKGELAWEQNEEAEAEKWLLRGTEVGGSRGEILSRRVLALRLLERGDRAAAMGHYERLRELVPDNTTVLTNLGSYYWETNQNWKMLSTYKDLYEVAPTAIAAYSLGVAYFNVEKYHEALIYFTEAFEGEPADPDNAIGLAHTHWALEDFPEARRWFEEALKAYDRRQNEGELDLHYEGQRAVCLAWLERTTEAVEAIEGLLQQDRDDKKLLNYATRIHALAKDPEGVYEYARRAIEAGYSPDALLKDPSLWSYRDDPELLEILGAQ